MTRAFVVCLSAAAVIVAILIALVLDTDLLKYRTHPHAMAIGSKSHFREVVKFKADYVPSEFAFYESERTGMRVAVVDQKGPKVYGYFALATEIHDDSGAPHTLEHLVFMGSKSYQYKGILDKLATRAYSGTNAWTATDHTAYTLETAGWDGFAQILPVYLEHVLVPTLTDAGCYTEVHHIDGDGNDAGVVYSEMQGVQNNSGELMELKARRIIYPNGTGFRYETGGLMENLRVLSADRIRAFHKEMYQPKNMCLVLIGEVDQPQLLQILDKFEETILGDVPRMNDPFTRPWRKSGAALTIPKTVTEIIEFPEEDESIGEILIGLVGPDYDDDVESAALNVFLVYICGSSVSLLENTMVEKEQLASAVYFSTDVRPDAMIWFTLSGVATKKLGIVNQRFFDILKEAADKPFDLDYIRECLRRFRRQLVFAAESSGVSFADPLIYDHLFGKRDPSEIRKLGTISELDEVETWDEARWKTFFKKWFLDAHHVTVIGKPSKHMAKTLEADEKARVEAQRKELGEEGLKKLKQKLEDAQAENDREVPSHILKDFEIPSADSVHFIPTDTARSGLARKMGSLDNEAQKVVDQDKSNVPFFIHFESADTNFVHINLLMNTHGIAVNLRPLLQVYILNFFDTPILRNGKRVEFEQVVVELERDTVDYSMTSGAYIGNSDLLRIRMQVEPSKYETAVSWIRDLLINAVFDEERIQSTIVKILADLPEEKRSGRSMCDAVAGLVHTSRDSTDRASNTLVKGKYLKRTLHTLKTTPAAVISKLETIRTVLCDPSAFRIFIFANLTSGRIASPVTPWSALAEAVKAPKDLQLAPLDRLRDGLSDAGRNLGKLAYIIPMQTIDSSFLYSRARGPDSYKHPQLPALTVALAYLEATEGPLWNAVRGTGLAYGVSFSRSVSRGFLTFDVYRSPDAFRAFAASKKTVADFASGVLPLDDLALEGAVSSVIVGFANEQPTANSAAVVGFLNQVIKEIPKDWGRGFMQKVRAVSKDEIKAVLKDVVLPVFDAGTADLFVTCSAVMEEKLVKGFTEAGFKPEVRDLGSFGDDYGLQPYEGEDDEDEDEDDDDDDDDDEEDEDEDEDQDEDEAADDKTAT